MATSILKAYLPAGRQVAGAGWAAIRTKDTYLRANYDSMVDRKGRKKALLILGHKILCEHTRVRSTIQPTRAIR